MKSACSPNDHHPPTDERSAAWLTLAYRVSSRAFSGVHLLWKNNHEPSEQKGWIKSLERVIAELELLNRNTEKDFLDIGGKVAGFISEVNQLSSELIALGDQEHGVNTTRALTHSLERSALMSERASNRSDGLTTMRQLVGQLKLTLSDFQAAVSTVHVLGVLTRIETARLGSAGADFGSLADEMKALAANVQSRIAESVDIADSLLPAIEDAIKKISATDESQSTIISGALASLSSLHRIQAMATESSGRLGQRYQAASQAFTKLIVSIQFHDITRQQVEHVIETLKHLCDDSAAASGVPAYDRHGVAAVLALQSLQLADAGEKFAASVTSVAQSLDNIASNVAQMAEESRTLSGISQNQTHSSLLDMERECTTILARLTHRDNTQSETAATREFLTSTIGRMQESIGDIQQIEIQMHLMALNAGICAAHIGAQGDALGFIAQSIQQRATHSKECSDSLVETLASMDQGANHSLKNANAAAKNDSDSDDTCVEEMRQAVTELHSSSERSFSQITQATVRAIRLGDVLSAARQSFTIGPLFANAIASAQNDLKEIAARVPAAHAPHGIAVPHSALAKVAAQYTMQAERDVHASLAWDSSPAQPISALAKVTSLISDQSDQLGDNVEFF